MSGSLFFAASRFDPARVKKDIFRHFGEMGVYNDQASQAELL